MNLDFMPSPSEEHPGLFIRDPFHYSDAMLIIPPGLIECLECFDGTKTELDLRTMLVRMTNDVQVGEIVQNLVETLSGAGFLEDEAFEQMKAARQQQFRDLPWREPAHAGTGYPAERRALEETMAQHVYRVPDGAEAGMFAIAAPHVSPEGGWQSYSSVYGLLGPQYKDRTFVVLGTSHYGEPETFGLTRKNFVTPLGEAKTDRGLVDRLESRGGAGVRMEDYCHSFEHTVEFQVLFLQHAVAPDVKIVPVLCGSFVKSLRNGGAPEKDDQVRAFLDELAELNEREGDRLFWVLGVDMAHMGARYGDPYRASAHSGVMSEVAERDRARIERINACDAAGFWDLVRPNADDLKWCGSSPFYSFLKAVPKARGQLRSYEQWNIDEQSVVSFAGMSFSRLRDGR